MAFGLMLGLSLAFGNQQVPDRWRAVRPQDGSFTIEFPDLPTQKNSQKSTPHGPIEINTYILKPNNKRPAFFFSYSQLVDKEQVKIKEALLIKRARESLVNDSKGKLLSERQIKLGDRAGLELSLELTGSMALRARIFACPDRLYQIVVVGNREQVNDMNATRFLLSFQLKKMASTKK